MIVLIPFKVLALLFEYIFVCVCWRPNPWTLHLPSKHSTTKIPLLKFVYLICISNKNFKWFSVPIIFNSGLHKNVWWCFCIRTKQYVLYVKNASYKLSTLIFTEVYFSIQSSRKEDIQLFEQSEPCELSMAPAVMVLRRLFGRVHHLPCLCCTL